MKYNIEIPSYLTIEQYKQILTIEHLEGNERALELIHIITGLERDVVAKWSPNDVSNLAVNVLSTINLDDAQFYPIIEFDGVLYGYRQMSKMKFGEFVDLERLAKDPVSNLEEIVALLYRPITKNNLGSIKYGIKQGFKIAQGKAENLFKYYDIKEYDNEERIVRADLMKSFPATMALGALSFFLGLGIKLSSNSNNYFLNEMQKRTTTKLEDPLLMSIGLGLQQLIHYQKVPSLTSQETKVYLT